MSANIYNIGSLYIIVKYPKQKHAPLRLLWYHCPTVLFHR